ncbi:hypothetical protein, partial [Mammaliicoccus vitulinus]|uniref:hypothetical protein n=1 Tax=Mammaliicoccus vitulinus TaxID=71237 RepID=UPI001ED916DD
MLKFVEFSQFIQKFIHNELLFIIKSYDFASACCMLQNLLNKQHRKPVCCKTYQTSNIEALYVLKSY